MQRDFAPISAAAYVLALILKEYVSYICVKAIKSSTEISVKYFVYLYAGQKVGCLYIFAVILTIFIFFSRGDQIKREQLR